ncbi:MAG: SDR family NAD(P)-dependent oxidoreductase [Calditrichaeota bacterium]|nr:MAG: SDR family NAD(P)-dependent oxidoreductase [Calditrichota bacterium]
MDFTNQVVLITGASRGIGKATAIEFANRNATVVINYRNNEAAANETLAALPGKGHSIFRADVCEPEALNSMIEATVERYGKLDVVVNNAGCSVNHAIEKVEFEEWQAAWRKVIDTNLIGAANVAFFAAKQMMQQKHGRMVFVSSRGAFRGEPTKPAYGASKAGMNALSQSLAKQLAPYNIFIGTVAPGFVATDMGVQTLSKTEKEAIERECPLKRVAKPEEVAYSIAFLASKGAEFSTGAILDVNGASYLRT